MNKLDAISQQQTDGFPMGVTEVEYITEEEVFAFIDGLDYAHDTDVYHGKPFRREEQWVVRVQVGDWGADEFDEEEGT
jgi:hypothetical protein